MDQQEKLNPPLGHHLLDFGTRDARKAAKPPRTRKTRNIAIAGLHPALDHHLLDSAPATPAWRQSRRGRARQETSRLPD
jgi:hypothetical protein